MGFTVLGIHTSPGLEAVLFELFHRDVGTDCRAIMARKAGKEVSFFKYGGDTRFPMDEKLTEIWMRNMKCGNGKPKSSSDKHARGRATPGAARRASHGSLLIISGEARRRAATAAARQRGELDTMRRCDRARHRRRRATASASAWRYA
ncbi:hypothetical protein MSG28_000886 [Choristoneura fumiferana]|uniref:Uncharacterized protein n=1 Tax=Choristoneura fumiferana TaxID=7141 RepID=A0ACC0K360_CHOFU|nr:hypothetical protein MSG28_000886 [Choristoneura fumiferana]